MIGILDIPEGGGFERTWRVVAPPKLQMMREKEGQLYSVEGEERQSADVPVTSESDLIDVHRSDPVLAQPTRNRRLRRLDLVEREALDSLSRDQL